MLERERKSESLDPKCVIPRHFFFTIGRADPQILLQTVLGVWLHDKERPCRLASAAGREAFFLLGWGWSMFALIPAVSGPLLHDVHDKTFRLAKGRACALPPATAASCPKKIFLCASVVSRYVALESMALILRRLVSARFLDVVNREKKHHQRPPPPV